MNRNIIFLSLCILTLAGCKSNIIKITGKLSDSRTGTYILLDELRSTELVTVDSIPVSNTGTFTITREVEKPSFYILKTDNENFLTMLLEPGQKIEIEARFDSLNLPISVSGSEGTEKMIGYNKRLRITLDQLRGLSDIYNQNLGNPELPVIMDRLDSLAQTYLNEISSFTKKYIDDNLTSLVSLVALYQQVAPGEYILHPEKDLRYFIKVDSSMSLLYPDYEPVKTLHEQVGELVSEISGQANDSMGPGKEAKAPEIELPGPDGDTIKLSSTRGKVVLLDFWASWCAPCRVENPNLVKAYNLYNRKGFQIYQVSLDKTREAWIKGIEDDKLEKWIHVSDLKYWNSPVVALYKIESIPSNLLLDEEGNIIAANLRGEMLHIKLAEVFNK